MKSEEEKYAELIISMTTDFLLKKIDFNHYANTLEMINANIQKMKCILNMKLELKKVVEVLSKMKDDDFYFKNYAPEIIESYADETGEDFFDWCEDFFDWYEENKGWIDKYNS